MWSSVPNLLTFGRIAAIPVIVGLFFIDALWARWLTLGVFVLAAVTDYLDGYLARAWQQQSALGRCFDPIADKLLVGVTILMLVGFERAPLVASAIIIIREITVSGLREFLAELQVGLPVSRLAKWKTMVQMVAIGFLIVGDAGPAFLPITEIGWYGLWIAALITLITGWDYLQASQRHFVATPGDGPKVNANPKTG